MATTTFTIPTASYPSGAHQFGPMSVPQADTLIVGTIDVTQMIDPATSYDAAVDISFDGGTQWQFLIGVHRPGGVLLDRNGNPVPTATFGIGLPDPTNPNRKLRTTLTIIGPITVGGTIQVS